MTTKHTPGPWRWSDEYPSANKDKTWSLVGASGYGILSCDGIANSPQSLGTQGDADAHLIAAAPDLLAALIALRDAVKASGKLNGREYVDLGIQVHRAITQAQP